MDILNKYLDFLWNCFQFDMHVFSQGWIYYCLLLPAAGYLIFFFLKWIVLTAPIWLPAVIIIRVSNLPSPKCKVCVYETIHEVEEMNKYKEKQREHELTPTP